MTIPVPNPARRCNAWGEPAINIIAPRDSGRHPGAGKAVDLSWKPKDRPCARCGAVFETTPKRRLLCERCFRDHG